MKSNEFTKLISSSLMNLDHTYRYSGTKLVEKETLSQHIIDTIMMGIKIIDELKHVSPNTGKEILMDKYIRKAVFHDLEEVVTGDIPRPLKYHDPATLESMREVADEVAISLFKKEFHENDLCFRIWEDAKLGNEGFILKIVDTLVVANKVVKEAMLLNNFYMLKVAHEVSQYLKEVRDHAEDYISAWDDPAKEYIYQLLDGALETMQDILDEHHSKLDLCNNSML